MKEYILNGLFEKATKTSVSEIDLITLNILKINWMIPTS